MTNLPAKSQAVRVGEFYELEVGADLAASSRFNEDIAPTRVSQRTWNTWHVAALWVSDPSRRAVWHAVQSTPATRATAAVTERELAAEIAYVLGPLTPGTPRERRTIMAEVILHVAYSMLNFSIRDGQSHAEAVVELKRLLAAYLLSANND